MNVCAFRVEGEPACEERLIDAEWESVKARICHIRARSPKGPRYDAGIGEKECGASSMTDVNLDGADLTNASFSASDMSTAITDSTTTCPGGEGGPCTSL